MIPFALPDLTPEEVRAVADSTASGWITSGKQMVEFENEVSQWVGGALQSIAVSSATAGLLLVLESLESKGEVVVPTITFAACASVVIQSGHSLVLSDVSEKTQCMTLDALMKVVTDDTVAVMLVHFAGTVSEDYERICEYCHKNGISVIEDAAHAFGTTYDSGSRVGSGGTYATVFSFYATKCITTGEGGMIITRSPELAKKLKQMRLHGISKDVFDRYTSKTPSWEYDVVCLGHKANMPDPAAAMGRVQLKREQQMRSRRKAIASMYDLSLPVSVTCPYGDNNHSRHLYPVRVNNRNQFIENMFSKEVGVSVHFKPIHVLKQFSSYKGSFPNANEYWGTCVSLPIYSGLKDSQVEKIIQTVRSSLC